LLSDTYGTVQDCYLPMNPETGEPRGFAFVTLKEDSADKAIEDLNGVEFRGRTLVVSLPLPPGEKTSVKKRTNTRGREEGRECKYSVQLLKLKMWLQWSLSLNV
jgi:RNA recognition motif-containing protein